MATFLFDEYIIPPINSRRFGKSLGINLLPKEYKICNFDCVYCECGWTLKGKKIELPKKELISELLENKLIEIKNNNGKINSITFAGNGEPTMHPDFLEIIKDTLILRDTYFPKIKITILSNGNFIHKKNILKAYNLVDNPVLKLDAGTEEMFQLIDQPIGNKSLDFITEKYKEFNDKVIIQTLFLKGEKEGVLFDNSNDKEVDNWIKRIKYISPKDVMIYTLDRDSPLNSIEKIPKNKLNEISSKLNKLDIKNSIYI